MKNNILKSQNDDFSIDLSGQPAINKDQIEQLRMKDQIRLLIISDSHQCVESIVCLLKHVPATDLILHLGDHAADYSQLASLLDKPMLIVKGNCDGYNNLLLPEIVSLSLLGHSILMLHGHHYKINVKQGVDRLKNFIAHQKPIPKFVLFGHTHIYHDESMGINDSKVRILNPGSCASTKTNLAKGIEIILTHSQTTVRKIFC